MYTCTYLRYNIARMNATQTIWHARYFGKSVWHYNRTARSQTQPVRLQTITFIWKSLCERMAFTFSLPLSSGGGGIGGRGLPFVSKLEKSSTSSVCKNTKKKKFVRKSFRLLHISLVRKFPISGFPISNHYILRWHNINAPDISKITCMR